MSICAPAPTGYLVSVRRKGHRNYETIGERPTKEAAYALLASCMVTGSCKRGEVQAIYEWYDAHLCIEMVNR